MPTTIYTHLLITIQVVKLIRTVWPAYQARFTGHCNPETIGPPFTRLALLDPFSQDHPPYRRLPLSQVALTHTGLLLSRARGAIGWDLDRQLAHDGAAMRHPQ